MITKLRGTWRLRGILFQLTVFIWAPEVSGRGGGGRVTGGGLIAKELLGFWGGALFCWGGERLALVGRCGVLSERWVRAGGSQSVAGLVCVAPLGLGMVGPGGAMRRSFRTLGAGGTFPRALPWAGMRRPVGDGYVRALGWYASSRWGGYCTKFATRRVRDKKALAGRRGSAWLGEPGRLCKAPAPPRASHCF
jgi:hypothetical protein